MADSLRGDTVRLIAARWETEQILVRDALSESDLGRLQAIWEGAAYIGAFDGHPERDGTDIQRELSEGDLPPGGIRERFKMQPFCSKGTDEMVGYATLYHGYPGDGTLWITFFCVDRSGQRPGYGRQFVEGLAREARRAGFRRRMLAVALKNWAAIRFWVKQGFNRVDGVYGDKDYAPDAFATLAVERPLIGK